MTPRTRATDDPARLAYVDAAQAWAGGAMLAYRPLARHLVDQCPVPLADALVLDVGAGTGAAGEVLHARGAVVVAADVQHSMLAAGTVHEGMRVVADLTAMPLRSAAFDIAVAAFVLNHLADPRAGLGELHRLVRPGGVVLASSFSIDRAPAKHAVDVAAAAFGWQAPPWYRQLQDRAARVGTADQLAAAARHAGLVDVTVTDTDVDIGLDDAASVARYRLAMPQLAGFVRALPRARRDALVRAAGAAVAAAGETFRPAVLELVARVSPDERRSGDAVARRARRPPARAASPPAGI